MQDRFHTLLKHMQKKIIVLFFVLTIKTIIYYSLFQIMMVVNSTHDKISYDTTERGKVGKTLSKLCSVTLLRSGMQKLPINSN